jgi:hypothetical protein
VRRGINVRSVTLLHHIIDLALTCATLMQKEGCVKQYMNPGGLKYHLEKGTCVVPVESAN